MISLLQPVTKFAAGSLHPKPLARWLVCAPSKMSSTVEQEVITLNKRMLDAIAAGDYATYAGMCDPSVTCFEPEALGHLIEGLPFHEYYFKMPSSAAPGAPPAHVLNTMASPKVRVVGDSCAILTYVRLTQKMVAGAPVTVPTEETRVYEKKDDGWKLVHLHRSPCTK